VNRYSFSEKVVLIGCGGSAVGKMVEIWSEKGSGETAKSR
jgi:hypothetical protein